MTIKPKVSRGARLLDLDRPGWADDLDPKRKRIVSVSQDEDVLGWLYGSYWEGGRVLSRYFCRHHPFVAADYGFSLPEDVQVAALDRGDSSLYGLWWELDAAWRGEVMARRRSN